nr:uncharacterized protein LOC115270290 [Aedes albopictus]
MWIRLTTLTCLTIATTVAQTIQLYDLTRNPGLLTLQSGNTLIKIGQHRIYHVIDLTKYKPLLDNIELAVDGLKIFIDYQDLTSLLKTKLEEVKGSYRRLIPAQHFRHKRGAFNFLGSAIKIITGNLDENDLKQINDDIKDLREKNQDLVRQNNIQVKLNRLLENRINKIIDSVNREQKIIKQQIIAARQTLIINRLINQNFTTIRQAFKISFHLDILQKHLDSIFEVIQLAKIHVISKNFLESEEIRFILDRLEEQNITILNPDQVYDYLDIRALFKGPILYFIIGVPQISPLYFNNLILEPLPIGGRTVKLPWHHAVIHGNLTYFIKDSCKTIGENTMCEEDQLEDVSDDGCFSKIIRGLPGRCTFTKFRNIIQATRLTDHHIVVKNASVTLISDCLQNDRKLFGTFLIFFSNCSISIDGKNFSTTKYASTLPTVIPMDGVKIEQADFEPILDLKELRKLHLENREELHIIKNRHFLQTTTSLGLSSICIILGICIGLYSLYTRKTKPDGTSLDNDTGNADRCEIVSGRSNLEGGAVKEKSPRTPTPHVTCKLRPGPSPTRAC